MTSGALLGAGRAAADSRATQAAWLGTLLLVAAQTMLFAGLVSAHMIFRWGARGPEASARPGPAAVTGGVAIVLLLASCLPLGASLKAAGRSGIDGIARGLSWTILLGAAFLLLQGMAWTRYAAPGRVVLGHTRVAIIAAHAVHLAGGLAWLCMLRIRLRGESGLGGALPSGPASLGAAALYWRFVAFLWPALYAAICFT